MKKALALLIALVITLSLFAGCTKSSDTATPTPTGSANSDGDTTDDQPGTIDYIINGEVDIHSNASIIQSAQRDVIKVGIAADCTNFNPWSYSGAGGNAAIWPLYQPLGYYIDGEFYPALAKEVIYAEDGMSVDVELFDYIYDSERNHLTADDAIFSYNASTLVWPEQADMVESLTKTGEYSFRFNMKRALRVGDWEGLVRGLVVSQKAFEASEDEMHTIPVGTGPYKLTSHTSGASFVYEKVEDFWQTDPQYINPRDMATVDKIEWYVIAEAAQRTIALQQGTIDACSAISAVDQPQFDGQNGHWLIGVPDNLSMYMFPNCDTTSPCSDLNLRLAISYAVSQEAVLQNVYGGNGTVMYDYSPNWAVGYDSSWESEDNYYQYDEAKAKEYLKKSNYNGEVLKIICDNTEASVNTAQLIQNFLKAIGVEASVNPFENSVFKQYITDPTQWDIQVATASSNGLYTQAIAFSLFSQSRYAWKGSINFIFDDELEKKIDLCMDGSTKTAAREKELRDYIVANCYAKGLVNITSYSVVPDWMLGLTMSIRKTIIFGGCVYSE